MMSADIYDAFVPALMFLGVAYMACTIFQVDEVGKTVCFLITKKLLAQELGKNGKNEWNSSKYGEICQIQAILPHHLHL